MRERYWLLCRKIWQPPSVLLLGQEALIYWQHSAIQTEMVEAVTNTADYTKYAYQFFKDFAGPIATLCAAAAAVFVTIHFNRRQTAISETQKNIALDKLKWDSHEERYKIYKQAIELISYVTHQHDFEKIDHMKIRDLRVKIDEARFFFGPSIQLFLDEIDRTAESLLSNLGVRWQIEDDADAEAWNEINEKLADDAQRLRSFYSEMPKRFEAAFGLSQLIRE